MEGDFKFSCVTFFVVGQRFDVFLDIIQSAFAVSGFDFVHDGHGFFVGVCVNEVEQVENVVFGDDRVCLVDVEHIGNTGQDAVGGVQSEVFCRVIGFCSAADGVALNALRSN